MLRNVGSNWALIVATLAATYVLTPFIIHTLGQDGYGTWTLITAMTGYISLLALGVPMACVRFLTEDVAAGNTRRMNETIGSCAGLYLACGVVACLIGAASLLWFAAYDIPVPIRGDALLAFGLMAINVSAGFIGLLPEGILFAHHDFVRRNAVRVGGVLLRLGLTVGLLALDASLVVMAAVQIACLVVDFSASWLIIRHRYPTVRISLANFRFERVRRIFSFSLYVLLLAAGARLSFQTDAIVIGAFQGVGSIPAYVIANSLLMSLMDFVIGIAAVVSPMATKLHTEGRIDDLRHMFLKWSKVATALTIVSCLCLMVVGPRFIGLWIDPSFERPAGVVLEILLVSSLLFLPVRGVAVPMLMGLGKPRLPAFAFIAAGLLNLALSIALVKPLGLAGVAIGTAIPNVLVAVFILRVACRELGIPFARCVSYVVPRSALGALPVLALLLWCRLVLDVQSFVGIAIACGAAVALFGVIWVAFVYRDDPYVDVKAYLLRMRGWSRA
jgi:O-antigen/teichoic acid export membrane protein